MPTVITFAAGCAIVAVFIVVDRKIGDKKELV